MPGPRSILGAYTGGAGEGGRYSSSGVYIPGYQFSHQYFNLAMATEAGGTHPTGILIY